MGNIEDDNIYNSYIKFIIKLEKICHFPGENINGTIFLKGKQGLKETLLNNPTSKVIISQKQHYYDNEGPGQTITNNIYEKNKFFKTFVGANLLNTVKIPFSIKLPISAIPSYSFKRGHYIKHKLLVEFPLLKVKRSLIIVVKNEAYFTKQNKLYKEPCIISNKKSKSKGNYNFEMILPKNVFFYDEEIPYEIKLDCTNLNSNFFISCFEIKLERIKKKGK